MNSNLNSKIVMSILGILIGLFFAVLLLSTLDIWKKEQIEFENSISFNPDTNEYIIGTITLENTGYLSQRFNLPKYTICRDDNQRSTVEYNNGEYSRGLFQDSSSYVDVPAQSQKQIKLTTSFYYNPSRDKPSDIPKALYLFLETPDEPYSGCINKDLEQADRVITITNETTN